MGAITPAGFVTTRDAIEILAERMFAGLASSPAAQAASRPDFQVRFTVEDLEKAAAVFWKDVQRGGITVCAEHPRDGMLECNPQSLLTVPLIRRYRWAGLTRLSAGHAFAEELYRRFGASFRGVQLLVSQREVDAAARRIARSIKRQATSASLGQRKRGRPSIMERVEEAIRAVVEEGFWTPKDTIKRLAQILARKQSLTVSDGTVSRALRQLQAGPDGRRFERPRKKTRTVKESNAAASPATSKRSQNEDAAGTEKASQISPV